VTTPCEITQFGPFRLNAAERLLERDGIVIDLGSRSLDVLIALVERAGEVLPRRELMARAWSGLIVDEANLRVNIASLRKSLGDGVDGARYIVNVPGRGYSFVAPVARVRMEARSPGPSPVTVTSRETAAGTGASWAEASIGSQLPGRPARLIGREDSIALLMDLLTRNRFVSVVGPGGMGKTSVAISVAHALLNEFNGAVYFVDLGSVNDASLVPGAIAAALGLRLQAQDPLPGLLEFLGARRALLVLDNCEHVIETAAELAERFYKSMPTIHLLATSRESLRAEGEHVHVLPPLAGPPAIDDLTASHAMTFPAVQLFMERAAASGVREPLTDEMAGVAGEICRRMDGIALAIELAASCVRSHGVRGTAELLDSRFNLLWQGRRSALPRHQTLQAMLDWSYNLLSETDRRVLARLSVFVGVFEPGAAQSVARDASLEGSSVAASVGSLIDKSLLASSTLSSGTYLRVLDTTRSYSSTKLAESGELPAISRRHAEYFLRLLGERPAAGTRLGFHRLAAQIGNIRAALSWCFSPSGDDDLGVRLAGLSVPHFLAMSLLDECHHWAQLALSRLGPQTGTATHLALQEALGISAMFTRGNGGDAREAIEHGLRLARALDDQQRELALLAGLHIFMTRVGDFGGAVEVGRRGVELAQRIDSAEGLVMAQWMLGCAFHLVGDQASALRHCEEGFEQAAARGVTQVDLFGYGHRTRALIVLARTLWLMGAVDRAAEVARQAVGEAEQGAQPVNRCIALLYSSTVFLWRGDAGEAEGLVNRLIQLATRYSLGPYLAVGIALSGEVALLKGESRRAVDRLRDALGRLHAEQHHILTTTLSRSMSEALLRCGEIEEAQAMINAAFERAQARGESFDMPDLLRTRAHVGIAAGRIEVSAAAQLLSQSIELAARHCALSLELRATTELGELLAKQGQMQDAHDRLAAVYGRFTQGHETRDLRTARQFLDAWKQGAAAQGA